ncbi:hypothetical protein D3C75_1038640 [compost metagenome]
MIRSGVTSAVLANPMRKACSVVGGCILVNGLLMHGRLNANAVEIAIDAAILDAEITLIDQVTHVSELFAAQCIKRLI